MRASRVPDIGAAWLYRIAHNTAIDVVTRRRELPSAELPDAGREDVVGGGALLEALAALPDRQRRVYVLREIHGLRIDETRAELGLSVQQVEQALFAARNRLAELLVFGERLSCVAVQRLAQGPLEGEERRGLKTHLRSCPACRRRVGKRVASLAFLPLPSLEWLRGLAGIGGAPIAAKVGVAVATVIVAAGVPLSLEHRGLASPRRADALIEQAAAPTAASSAAGTDARVLHGAALVSSRKPQFAAADAQRATDDQKAAVGRQSKPALVGSVSAGSRHLTPPALEGARGCAERDRDSNQWRGDAAGLGTKSSGHMNRPKSDAFRHFGATGRSPAEVSRPRCFARSVNRAPAAVRRSRRRRSSHPPRRMALIPAASWGRSQRAAGRRRAGPGRVD